jgi:hypothetical protein
MAVQEADAKDDGAQAPTVSTPGSAAPGGPDDGPGVAVSTPVPEVVQAFALERYRYILQQTNAINENVFRFLALYQTIATALVSGGLALFVGYRTWGITRSVARDGVIGALLLVTFIAAFMVVFLVVGTLSWLDYRHEECDLTDAVVYPGFRSRPKVGNAHRWYELYIILFILLSTVVLWVLAWVYVLPAMK